MTDLFLQVLNGSFAASWLVLAVILARLLLKKAPRWMVCGLWALVAVRLVFGGIDAPFSLLPSGQIIPPESLFDAAPTIHSGISSIDNAINPVYTESLRPTTGASVNPLQVWLAVYANIWGLGAAAMALWALHSWGRVRRQVRESIPAREGVYLCDRIASPFIFGLFRPNIYLPSNLDGEARSYVIAHERAHLRRRDHWWKPLGFALLAVNWFNPLLWLAYILLCRDIELACDEKVVRHFSVEEKKAYSAALLGCAVNSRRITACPLAFGEVGVKQRVRSVLHYKKPTLWIILAAAVVTAVIAVSLLTDPVDRVSEIRYNGQLYVLFNDDYSFLPVDGPVGELAGILHRTDAHPSENFQGTNLDESLAGCPLYLENDLLFLQKFDGTCLAFRLADAEERTFTWGNISLEVTLPAGWEAEELSGAGFRGFRFRSENHDGWVSVKYWDTLVVEYKWAGTVEERLFPSGLTGKIYRSEDPDEWRMVWFFDDECSMSAELPDGYLWPTEYFSECLNVIGTIRAFRDGEALFVKSPTGLMQLLMEDWDAWDALTPLQQMASSHLPGSCTQGLDDWSEVEAFIGMEIPNPLEELDSLEKGCFAGTPVGYNGASRFQISFRGDRQGNLEQLSVRSGYRRDGMRISVIASVLSGAADSGPVITADTGEEFEARTATLTRDSIEYYIRVIGEPGTGETLASLLNDLLPYFVEPRGITLTTETITNRSLQLVYTHLDQDAQWARIVTTPAWSLEAWTEDGWVNVLPPGTAWEDVAYELPVNGTVTFSVEFERVCGILEPGHYRIGKHFYTHPEPEAVNSTTGTYEQTCWAEFDIP